MRKLIISLFLFVPFALAAQNTKEIAITFDDSPRFAGGYLSGPERAKLLIDNLRKHNVRETAFFCNPSSNSRAMTQEGKARLQTFSDAGHIIANHTFSHPNFNETSADKYIQNIEKADQVLNSYPTFVKWFRFPYLREGDTPEKRDRVRHYLKQNAFFNAYITIDTYDWHMETVFQQEYKQNPNIDLEKVKAFFVDTTLENIEIADANANKLLARSPKHVLLLHETDLSALFIGDLVDALRAKGWKVISPKEAYKDEIADFELTGVYKWNPGRIGEMALENPNIQFDRPETLTEEGLEKRFASIVLNK